MALNDVFLVRRKQRGLSRADVGQKIGRSRHTVQSYELGRHEPPSEVWPAYADVLGLTLDEFRTLMARAERLGEGSTYVGSRIGAG